MRKQINIRLANPDDAFEIDRITKAAFKAYEKSGRLPTHPAALTETTDDILRDIKEKTVIIAEKSGEIAGALRLAKNDDALYLSRFAVDCGLQKNGIGKALLDKADSVASEMGIKKIYLHTACDIKPLMNFYASCGFIISEINYEKGYSRATLIKNIT